MPAPVRADPALRAFKKDELVGVIQRQGQRQIERVLRERVARHSDPVDRLAEAIRSHVLLSDMLRPWFVFLYMEARQTCPARHDRFGIRHHRARRDEALPEMKGLQQP